MEQFRPAAAIEADRALADAFRGGDDAAIRAMVERFGPPVASLLAAHGASESAADVFVQAWVESDEFDSGNEMGPWLRSIAHTLIGASDDASEAKDERRWELATATTSFDRDAYGSLRALHVEQVELAAGADRHELRLRRRLGHLGADTEIDAALADPFVWERPDDAVADRVVERIAAASESAADPSFGRSERSRLARSVRPVLLGLGGAVFVLFAAILVLSAAGGEVDEPAFTVEMIPTGLLVEVEPGDVTVTERDSGVEFDLDAFTLPRRIGGQIYVAVLVLDDGTELSAGSFNEGIGVRLTAGVELEQIEAMLVVAAETSTGIGDSADADVILKADFTQN